MSKHEKHVRRERKKTDRARRWRSWGLKPQASSLKSGATALAAAAVIAAGTQAYASPVRYDNPAGVGHFQWGPGGSGFLDLTSDPGGQTAGGIGPGVFSQGDYYGYGSVVQTASPGGMDSTFAGVLNFLNPIDAGVPIPTGADMPDGSFIESVYPGYEGSLLPEGVQTYLGVSLDLGSGLQYGWIGVERTGLELDAFAWGYETEVGVPIPAGVPEPGSLALLALGAGAALRRRR